MTWVRLCASVLGFSSAMPWNTTSLFGERLHFVQAVLRRVASVAQWCVRFNISQKTDFQWLRQQGPTGAPRESGRVCARSIAGPRCPACAPCTVAYSAGAEAPAARPRATRTGTGSPGLHPAAAAQRGVDGRFQGVVSHPRRRAGRSVDRPRCVQPLHPGIRRLRHRHEPLRQYFQGLFQRYGLPQVVRFDHGPPFAGDGALDLSRLSAGWARWGIRVEFTGRARPQDNAAHEQIHRIYKAGVASPPAATPRGQQWRTTRWVQDYIHQRPHEALSQRVPAGFYRPSRRRFPGGLPELRYPRAWLPPCHRKWLHPLARTEAGHWPCIRGPARRFQAGFGRRAGSQFGRRFIDPVGGHRCRRHAPGLLVQSPKAVPPTITHVLSLHPHPCPGPVPENLR